MFKPLILLSMTLSSFAMADLVVMTDRPQSRYQKAAQIFAEQTGGKVTFIEAQYPALLTQLSTGTQADLILIKDLVLIADLQKKDLLKSFPNFSVINNRVASSMRDPAQQWTALTFRTRTLAYNPAAVDPQDIQTYADLAKPEWAGRLCLRTSKADYNVALTGNLLLKYGEEKTTEILSGWLQNLAMDIFPNDTALLENIANGNCDVGIVNHYYLAQILAQKPTFPVKLHFLSQAEDGVHTNGSAIALLKISQQDQLAQSFVDILHSPVIQQEISAAHFEFPAVIDVTPTTLIKDWGTFFVSPFNWGDVGSLAPKAKEVMTKVGYL